jgi:hypothetical protein
LVEKESRLKANGCIRNEFDIVVAMKQIYSINTDAQMFATDLPSMRAPRAYTENDFNLIVDPFTNDEAKNIFYNNAIELY